MTSFENIVLPPNNYEVEKNIISCILLDEGILFDCPIVPTDFYNTHLSMIYSAILSVKKSHRTVDVVTVGDELQALGYFDAIGGMDFLYDLATGVLTTSSYNSYKDILLELSYLRKVLAK